MLWAIGLPDLICDAEEESVQLKLFVFEMYCLVLMRRQDAYNCPQGKLGHASPYLRLVHHSEQIACVDRWAPRSKLEFIPPNGGRILSVYFSIHNVISFEHIQKKELFLGFEFSQVVPNGEGIQICRLNRFSLLCVIWTPVFREPKL
jgi:hypothetical protein